MIRTNVRCGIDEDLDAQHVSVGRQIIIHGAVQGVGFRPFIYRLALDADLRGYVANTPQGVLIEVEGAPASVGRFAHRIQSEAPPLSSIQAFALNEQEPKGFNSFRIRESVGAGEKHAIMLPDIAACGDCLREMLDLQDHRYRYPFTNCTHCGPRFSIIETIPYDRRSTSMKQFVMCPECRLEYEDPLNRRFHTQPNACPACGPHLELWDATKTVLAQRDDALVRTVEAIRQGQIVAVKGLGGFHLLVDASNNKAIDRLRDRKHREEKPFALMFPNLSDVESVCNVSELEKSLLLSPEAPLVLLERRGNVDTIAESVAPGNPHLVAMLPYTPLHHLLLYEFGMPVVATSGNVSDEPICIDENEAVVRLRDIADLFLMHDRPIVRPVDDSVVRVMCGQVMIMRRSRGYAPLPMDVGAPAPTIIAMGGHLKNTVGLVKGAHVFLSQHLGDLETLPACDAFDRAVASVKNLYDATSEYVVHDLHPDYYSTKAAHCTGLSSIAVQHHHAHIVSCMAEHQLEGDVLGVAWDGAGYGPDGTVWGGEFLVASRERYERFTHFRVFSIPGGDAVAREPRRSGLGVLYGIWGRDAFSLEDSPTISAFSRDEIAVMECMLERELNTPKTSSVGRLFDAVSSLIGLRQKTSFEGQSAMELEWLALQVKTEQAYEMPLVQCNDGLIIDWEPSIRAITEDIRRSLAKNLISAKFHNAIINALCSVAVRAGLATVVLSGGCFQNKYLLEGAVEKLQEMGLTPVWHSQVPTNDGGIALGQAACAVARLREKEILSCV